MKISTLAALAFIALLFPLQHARAQGIITTIAGNGVTQYIGDGWPATNYSLATPYGICIDKDRTIYEADYIVARIRRLDAHDTIFTYAGIGVPGYSGDGGAATAAEFRNPIGVALDTAGNLYVLEEYTKVVRKITKSTGIITTVCGSGMGGFGGDGGPALAAKMEQPAGISVDRAGNIYIADYGNQRIRKVNAATGIISTVAGTGASGYSGDGGAAVSSKLSYPKGVYVDTVNNIYIADYGNNRVRRVDGTTGIISTVAGIGSAGYAGDGGSAVNAKLVQPQSVFMSKRGNLYIADYGNNVVRAVTPDGIIHTVAGNGSAGYGGDGGPALSATMQGPAAVCVDDSEYLYIADVGNAAIRKVTPVYTKVNDLVRNNTISVFPNPATDLLYLGGVVINTKQQSVKIFNTTGVLVYEQKEFSGEPIDIGTLTNGMYFLYYANKESYYTAKFIVKR